MFQRHSKLVHQISLLSHERGLEMNTEEVFARADALAAQLQRKGIPADRRYALELMTQLLGSSDDTPEPSRQTRQIFQDRQV